jgi:hypothetical protein
VTDETKMSTAKDAKDAKDAKAGETINFVGNLTECVGRRLRAA